MSEDDTTRAPRPDQDATPPSGSPTGGPTGRERSGDADVTGARDQDPTGASPSPPSDDPTIVASPASGPTTSRAGRVRYQDPETTTPREPSVGEQRARREAERRNRAQREAAEAAASRKQKTKKRILVGGGVAVGVVALVAVIYAASDSGEETTAQCVDQNTNMVVPDDQCGGEPTGGYTNSSGVFVPLFIPLGGFGNSYRYNYGSNSPVGSIANGGSAAAPPSGTSLRGSSGSSVGTSSSSGTVSRGGLGVSGSSSSGSSSGGSSSGS